MAKKQLVFIAFGCLSAGTKFTVNGKAFIKIKKDIIYNPDENSALQVSTGEIYFSIIPRQFLQNVRTEKPSFLYAPLVLVNCSLQHLSQLNFVNRKNVQ